MSDSPTAADKKTENKKAAKGCGCLLVLVFLVVGGIAALTGGGNSSSSSDSSQQTEAAPTTTPDPIPAQQGAAGPDNPAAQRAESAFLSDLRSADVPITSQSTIQAYSFCLVVHSGTSETSAQSQLQAQTGLTDQQIQSFGNAADTTICPRVGTP